MGILDDNPVEQQNSAGKDIYFGTDLIMKIEKALGLKGLRRVVIDISYGRFVDAYIVIGRSGEIMRAIDLEDLLKGMPLTELGLDKEK